MDEKNAQRLRERQKIENMYVCNLNKSEVIDILKKINNNQQYVIFRMSDTVENTVVATIKTTNNKILHVRFIREPNGQYATESEYSDEYEYLNPQELITHFSGSKIIVLNKIQVLELIRNQNVFAEAESDSEESFHGQKNHFRKCTIM